MPGDNVVVNEHKQTQPSFSFFCKGTKAMVWKGSNCISAWHVSPFKPYMHNSLQSTNLCVHIMDRGLQRQHDWDNTQVVLLRPAQSLTQTEQCLLIAVNALHSFGWQKNNIPYQQVEPLRARPTMKTLSPQANRLWSLPPVSSTKSCTGSPHICTCATLAWFVGTCNIY